MNTKLTLLLAFLIACGGGEKDPGANADVDGDGHVASEDCDDNNNSVFPGATEIAYDGIDQDCTDGDLADVDGDGYDGAANGAAADDCDDNDVNIGPDSPEIYYDGIDNDCYLGTVDDDQDSDGVMVDDDCDDTEATVAPGMAEVYYDGLDNDCDPLTIDDDQDDDGDPIATDCNDTDSLESSLLTEILGDLVDNDCDPNTLDFIPIDPVAVGFDFNGVILQDGTLSGYYDGINWVDPSVTLVFASSAFFQTTDPAIKDLESCRATATFQPAPESTQIPLMSAVTLHSSYQTNINITAHTCANRADPSLWGVDGADLIAAFQGAHIGVGFGDTTGYLTPGNWDPVSLAAFRDSMVGTYVAMNVADGSWIGDDWTSSVLYEWDEVTETPLLSPGGLLVPIDITAVPSGSGLPEGYLTSRPRWYQDFFLLDLTNLADPPI